MPLLIQRFFSICQFQSGPQDLPPSKFLLLMSLLAYALMGLILALNKASLGEALAMVAVDVALLASLSWGLLWTKALSSRYTQTLTALAGCGALLAACAWPLLLWQQQSNNDANTLLVSFLLWLWFLWLIMVFSNIISQALSSKLLMGSLWTVLYIFISDSIAQILFFQETL